MDNVIQFCGKTPLDGSADEELKRIVFNALLETLIERGYHRATAERCTDALTEQVLKYISDVRKCLEISIQTSIISSAVFGEETQRITAEVNSQCGQQLQVKLDEIANQSAASILSAAQAAILVLLIDGEISRA